MVELSPIRGDWNERIISISLSCSGGGPIGYKNDLSFEYKRLELE